MFGNGSRVKNFRISTDAMLDKHGLSDMVNVEASWHKVCVMVAELHARHQLLLKYTTHASQVSPAGLVAPPHCQPV
ncbi:hypothetical protein CEXT_423521 [Caerostris extrusa]|uniref:Uncharacterized protein n=1 Tax=Caerostris extrusa TaxID=172846 RepID=A0AAV4V6K6_CAEEX|nr:hypothetical protein CEXT_423521 [Caerostris extrusa]